ncbi:hypothetical protein NUW54_g13488 [Trametes sanguinea]|uniref:Uncharacterized protein n=1 Tax=Trametes sanguinea TaxID=158606 RepID=A0ACC1MLI5_9APHY|nr:hypothetical protein NUW54_g13488 [Trametes sanguinea]
MAHLAPSGKWDARYLGPVPHDASYYAKCMLGGALACGITHAGITPLDVTKCNMQVNPAKYKGLLPGLRTIVAEEGSKGLWKGFGPTFVGYSLQDVPSPTIALCPLEMTKVKIQTSQPGTFPVPMFDALREMSKLKAETRYPLGSLVPLWSRQIPYTMAKFFFFEYIVTLFYRHVFTKPKESYGQGTQLGITFASGYLAGVVCALVSHPADSLVSLMGKPANRGKSLGQIASETGLVALATRALARVSS